MEEKEIKLPAKEIFRFKQFEINQKDCAMKVGTDGVLLGAWADVSEVYDVLDIGTGTGVIAIMLAQRIQNANIDAVEVSEMACERANENMQNSPFSKRLKSIHDTIQDFSKTTRKEYDLIVCNPPFFTGGTLSAQNGRNNVRHTVKLPHGDLLSSVRRLLKKTGKFCVILPLIEGLRFKELAKTYNFCCNKVTEVKSKHDKSVERLLLEFGKTNVSNISDTLVIQYEKRNDYTADYIALTKDFYLKM